MDSPRCADIFGRSQKRMGAAQSHRVPGASPRRMVLHVLYWVLRSAPRSDRRGAVGGWHWELDAVACQSNYRAHSRRVRWRRVLQTFGGLRRERQALDALVQRPRGGGRTDWAGDARGGGVGVLRAGAEIGAAFVHLLIALPKMNLCQPTRLEV